MFNGFYFRKLFLCITKKALSVGEGVTVGEDAAILKLYSQLFSRYQNVLKQLQLFLHSVIIQTSYGGEYYE